MILVIGAGFQCTKGLISVTTCNPAEDADLPLHVAAGRALRVSAADRGRWCRPELAELRPVCW
jgi:hypothetical protein